MENFQWLEQVLVQGNGVIFLDGGLATQLEDNGVVLDTALWSSYCLVACPSMIKQIHKLYLSAGSRIVTTCTYQANFAGFETVGIEKKQALSFINLAVDLAYQAKLEFSQESLQVNV